MYKKFHRFWENGNESFERTCNEPIQAYLGEPNGCRFFSETLTAQIKSVFADETCLVGTESARVDDETMDYGVLLQVGAYH